MIVWGKNPVTPGMNQSRQTFLVSTSTKEVVSQGSSIVFLLRQCTIDPTRKERKRKGTKEGKMSPIEDALVLFIHIIKNGRISQSYKWNKELLFLLWYGFMYYNL